MPMYTHGRGQNASTARAFLEHFAGLTIVIFNENVLPMRSFFLEFGHSFGITCNRTLCRSILSVIILVIKKSGRHPLRLRPILLITHMNITIINNKCNI